jgi:hypothetical protein
MPKLIGDLIIERCPHCNIDKPNFLYVHKFQTFSSDGLNRRFWTVYSCKRCGGAVTAFSTNEEGDIHQMYPKYIGVDNTIPEKARAYLEQAINSLHSPAGSVMLSASSVDAMLKEKGYKEGNLYNRIDKAKEDHIITDDIAEWAHEIRLDANDQRHADDLSPLPNESDAQKSIDFALALGQFLFVLPARIKRGLETAKK